MNDSRAPRPGNGESSPVAEKIKKKLDLPSFLLGILFGVVIMAVTLGYQNFKVQQEIHQRMEEAITKGRKDIHELERQLDSLRQICKNRPSACSFIS